MKELFKCLLILHLVSPLLGKQSYQAWVTKAAQKPAQCQNLYYFSKPEVYSAFIITITKCMVIQYLQSHLTQYIRCMMHVQQVRHFIHF